MLKPVRSGLLNKNLMKFLGTPDKSNDKKSKAPQINIHRSMKQLPFEQSRLNLLVAEDNRTNQLVVKTMLKGANVELTFANDGAEAIKLYQEIGPDMIFMDMSMPEMDGVEATKWIRDLESEQGNSQCPIIALTANAMVQDRERCELAGMNDFLAKPIKKQQLLDSLKKWGRKSELAA